jgi:hypothetical protein
MTTVFVRHQVADYAVWRGVFDSFAPTATTLGALDGTVYQAVDDPNDVTVIHNFADSGAAHAFAGSSELRAAMHDAGVVGAPTVWFADKA